MPSKITNTQLITSIVEDFKQGFSKKDLCEKYKL